MVQLDPAAASQEDAEHDGVGVIGQLGALEKHGGFDFELIRTLLGPRLIDRWEMWQPSINAIGPSAAYPMFERLVTKMRAAA